MDEGYEKERFESLSIKRSVVKKFRKYSKSISKSNSMTLLSMVEYFERNELSPEDDLKPGLMGIENRIKKRINAVIAIIKDIEKNQTKPTVGMMLTLFAEAEPKEETRIRHAKSPEEFKAQFEKNKAEAELKIDNR